MDEAMESARRAAVRYGCGLLGARAQLRCAGRVPLTRYHRGCGTAMRPGGLAGPAGQFCRLARGGTREL